MEIEVFCLCRSIEVCKNNEPTLHKIFDKIRAEGEPVRTHPFFVAASIRFYRSDEGKHTFTFLVKENSGTVLIRSEEIVSISALNRDSTTILLQCYMGPTGLKLGRYDFSIESGGTQLAHTPLYVELGNA